MHQLQILLPVDRKILVWGSLKQKDFNMVLPILMATLMLGLHKRMEKQPGFKNEK